MPTGLLLPCRTTLSSDRLRGVVAGRHDDAVGLHGAVHGGEEAAHDLALAVGPRPFAGLQRRRPLVAALQCFLQQRPIGRIELRVVAQRPGGALGEDRRVGRVVRLIRPYMGDMIVQVRQPGFDLLAVVVGESSRWSSRGDEQPGGEERGGHEGSLVGGARLIGTAGAAGGQAKSGAWRGGGATGTVAARAPEDFQAHRTPSRQRCPDTRWKVRCEKGVHHDRTNRTAAAGNP